jgi:hypothetical protein
MQLDLSIVEQHTSASAADENWVQPGSSVWLGWEMRLDGTINISQTEQSGD